MTNEERYVSPEEAYQLLAAAIIQQAAEDYINARSEHRLEECRNFFLSGWFEMLSDELDGEELLKMLERKREERWLR